MVAMNAQTPPWMAKLTAAGIPIEDGAWLCERAGIGVVRVPGHAAEALWAQLRAVVDQTGLYPIILGGDGAREELSERLAQGDAERLPAEALAGIGPIADLDAWAATRLLARAEEAREDEMFEEAERFEQLIAARARPPLLTPHNRKTGVTLCRDTRTQDFLEQVDLALLPTTVGWQAPLLLAFGGWNECPGADEQAALMQNWGARYGAEPIAIGPDVVEMKVARPPATSGDAYALSLQHYAYCADIVDQGTETVDALAEELLGSNAWFFWWD